MPPNLFKLPETVQPSSHGIRMGSWGLPGTSDFLQALLEIKQGQNSDISVKRLANILPTVYVGEGKRRPGSRGGGKSCVKSKFVLTNEEMNNYYTIDT